MPRFNVFFEGEDVSHAYFAASPAQARRDAQRTDGRPIRKIKLDRETVDPAHRAPRLTLRELTKDSPVSLAAQVVARSKAFAALHQAVALPPGSNRAPLVVTEPAHVVAKLASDMLDIAAVKGCAEEDDLLGRGWTLDAIRKHGPAARDRANLMSERQL